jgi:hypothetical protein
MAFGQFVTRPSFVAGNIYSLAYFSKSASCYAVLQATKQADFNFIPSFARLQTENNKRGYIRDGGGGGGGGRGSYWRISNDHLSENMPHRNYKTAYFTSSFWQPTDLTFQGSQMLDMPNS